MRELPATLPGRLRRHAHAQPGALALGWVPELSRDAREELTFAQLLADAERIAGGLQARAWSAHAPRMALLAFPPGLDFIRTFLACLLARVVAVPVALPRRAPADTLAAIAANCAAPLALTCASEQPRLAGVFAATPALQRLPLEGIGSMPAARFAAAEPGADDLAFVQYTSGSSSRPKGVCVTHRNLVANLALIQRSLRVAPDQVIVNWLPHYHDMGLIGDLLMPLFVGVPSVSMAPSAFIKRPLKWLQLIAAESARGDVLSGGPNFAYQLCADRVADADAAALSLGRWVTAFNGAEPVRASTLDAFATRFRRCGFAPANFYPCYGLAETTLFATGGHAPARVTASVAQLERGHIAPAADPGDARVLVSSGRAEPDRIAVVDPATRRRVPDGSVGEIWVTGPSVPSRYLNDTDESVRTYGNSVAGEGAARYLATGDLGAVVDGELYVTGRAKELLIVNGRNVHPHDVEALLRGADARIERTAVFAWRDPQGDREVVVAWCELARAVRQLLPEGEPPDAGAELERLAELLRVAAAPAEVVIDHVRFTGPLGLPLTSSGKTAYGQLRREFGSLDAATRARATSALARRPADAGAGSRHAEAVR